MANIIDVEGIGEAYATPFTEAGLGTIGGVLEAGKGKVAVNAQNNLVNRTPSLSEVTNWIDQAKSLPRVVTH